MTGPATAQGRGREAAKVIGPALHHKLATLRTLVVGAGGIGCELLKNLVCAGFGDVTIVSWHVRTAPGTRLILGLLKD